MSLFWAKKKKTSNYLREEEIVEFIRRQVSLYQKARSLLDYEGWYSKQSAVTFNWKQKEHSLFSNVNLYIPARLIFLSRHVHHMPFFHAYTCELVTLIDDDDIYFLALQTIYRIWIKNIYNDYNHKEVARASRIGLRPSGLRW